jgi:hypothetical protein
MPQSCNRIFGKCDGTWADNIDMDLGGLRHEDGNWIQGLQRQNFATTILKSSVPQNGVKFLDKLTVNFKKKTVLLLRS